MKLYVISYGSGFYHICRNNTVLACRYRFIKEYCECPRCNFKFPIILTLGSINEHAYN